MDDWQFKRQLDEKILNINDLLNSELFKRLKEDILKGEVFPAIRNNSIDFYYRGGRLLGFSKDGFQTHIKYASVYDYKHPYVNEKNLKNMKPIAGFLESYERIKENCEKYTSVEPYGVSKLYKFSPFTSKVGQIVLLDVEISFKKTSEKEEEVGFQDPQTKTQKSKMDRIDLLLYDTSNRILHFIEAKHFSNGEIWSTTEPKVIEQVRRYNKQLSLREEDIKKVYGNYIDWINKLFKSELLPPVKLTQQTGLYIFGFDDDQKPSVVDLQKNLKQKGIPVCIIEDPKDIKIDKLWKETCK